MISAYEARNLTNSYIASIDIDKYVYKWLGIISDKIKERCMEGKYELCVFFKESKFYVPGAVFQKVATDTFKYLQDAGYRFELYNSESLDYRPVDLNCYFTEAIIYWREDTDNEET